MFAKQTVILKMYNNYFSHCPLIELVESRSSEDSVKLLSM